MNKYTFTGTLGQDPKHYPNEDAKKERVHFSVAVNNNRKRVEGEEDKTQWISVVAFGATAKYVNTYAKKGSRILVEGPLSIGSYTNKDGVVIPTGDVVANSIELFNANSTGSTSSAPVANSAASVDMSDIPF